MALKKSLLIYIVLSAQGMDSTSFFPGQAFFFETYRMDWAEKMKDLDSIDWKILKALQKNARLTCRELSQMANHQYLYDDKSSPIGPFKFKLTEKEASGFLEQIRYEFALILNSTAKNRY